MRLPSTLLLLAALFAVSIPVPAEPGGEPMIIATRQVPPFAMRGPDGQWRGLSIELWEELARRLDFDYELKEMGLQEMLAAYEQAVKEHAAAPGQTYTATAGDHSIIAQDGSVVNTSDGVAVGGDVGGDINLNQRDKKE